MRFWISPFELTNPGLGLLEEAGLQPWEWEKGTPPSQDCLLLYDSPDQLLANSSSSPGRAITTPEQLLESYLKVLDWSQQAGQPMLAIWRLQQLGPGGLVRWLAGGGARGQHEALPHLQAPAISPLVAAATLALIEACPKLLDSYLDIELKAELFGGDADLNYRQCLRQASMQWELLLQALHANAGPDQQDVREAELNDAREEAGLTLLQLLQAQEDLEALTLANQEKQQLLASQTNELETRFAECAGLRQQLELREGELKEIREEAELTLLQLHQVQEELERYFLENQDFARLASDAAAITGRLWIQHQVFEGVAP